jgi:hypothetical protein
LARADLYQLLGYALLDFTDTYRLQAAGVYFARFGYLAQWQLPELITRTSGRDDLDLPTLRQQFAELLHQDRQNRRRMPPPSPPHRLDRHTN